jgi:hypothetical protein
MCIVAQKKKVNDKEVLLGLARLKQSLKVKRIAWSYF